MKILAFAGSTSSTSINRELVKFVLQSFPEDEINLIDLNDFEMPLFSVDKEQNGFPKEAQKFLDKIEEADFLVVSLAEHNGNYTAAFKNILDWASRINNKIFQGKKMLLMATSPGGRGGKSVLEIATDRFPRHDANLIGTFSLPSFYENFDEVNGITSTDLKKELLEIVNSIDL